MSVEADSLRLRHAFFWMKLLRLTRGRISLVRAVEIIEEEESHEEWARVIRQLRELMGQGRTLADAVCEQPAVFSLSVRELVVAAERSGAWEEIMQELADGLREGTFS